MAFVTYPDIPGLQNNVCTLFSLLILIWQLFPQGLHHAEGLRLQVSPRPWNRPRQTDRDREGPRGQDRAPSGGPVL